MKKLDMNEVETLKRVLAEIENFDAPITSLEAAICGIPDPELRKSALRSLADVMGTLDAEIGHLVRKKLRHFGA